MDHSLSSGLIAVTGDSDLLSIEPDNKSAIDYLMVVTL